MFKRKINQTTNIPAAGIAPEASHLAVPQQTPTPPQAGINEAGARDARHISIISNDLTILGKDLEIISKGSVQVDGEIRGDIRGIDVTVGKYGKVIGVVSGERVVVDGEVLGKIQAKQVTLRSNARVDGDILHQSLAMELGAIFNGTSKRQTQAPEPIRQERAPEFVKMAQDKREPELA